MVMIDLYLYIGVLLVLIYLCKYVSVMKKFVNFVWA